MKHATIVLQVYSKTWNGRIYVLIYALSNVVICKTIEILSNAIAKKYYCFTDMKKTQRLFDE